MARSALEAKTATYGAETLGYCRSYYERQYSNVSAPKSPWSVRTKTHPVGDDVRYRTDDNVQTFMCSLKNEMTTDRRQCRTSVCERSFIQNLRFSDDEFPNKYRRRRLRSRTTFSFLVVTIFRLHSVVPRGIINTCKSSNIFSWLYLPSTTYHCRPGCSFSVICKFIILFDSVNFL
jgi:hypothetical protein